MEISQTNSSVLSISNVALYRYMEAWSTHAFRLVRSSVPCGSLKKMVIKWWCLCAMAGEEPVAGLWNSVQW